MTSENVESASTDADPPPLVSIVVPARNEEASIAFALDSIAAQSYPRERIEVVVVDGGSTDRTAAVAAGQIDSLGYARFAVLDNPVGSTPTNLNMGLAWCRGDIVVRVDARSSPPQDYVARLVDVMNDSRIAVAGGSQIASPRSDSVIHQAIARALNNRLGMGGASYRRTGAASGTTDTAYLGVFRRSQLDEAGGWNPDYPTNQDFELNQRMMRFGSVWFEAGLPVRYLPRGDLKSLVSQYHRFGRWKATYWSDGNRPGTRQWVLLAIPTLGLVAGFPVAALFASTVGVPQTAAGLLAAGVIGAVSLDALGGHTTGARVATRILAGLSNVAIGASWYSGVVRQTLLPTDATTSTSGQATAPLVATKRPSSKAPQSPSR